MSDALKAFKALRRDVDQFDDRPPVDPSRHDSNLFSERVPLFMKSYLVNWLRKFVSEHGDEVEAALKSKTDRSHPMTPSLTGKDL